MPIIRDRARLGQAATVPAEPLPGSRLEVVVLHTDLKGTLRAVRAAAFLAQGLGARIRLLAPQVVPYILPLTSPPVPTGFTEQRLTSVASESPVETRIDIRVCRDVWDMLKFTLPPRSLIVLGARRHWWPTQESRLARRLRRLGHQILWV
jgi:hypothetical protein